MAEARIRSMDSPEEYPLSRESRMPPQATAPGRMIVPPCAIAWAGTMSLSGHVGVTSGRGCAGTAAGPIP